MTTDHTPLRRRRASELSPDARGIRPAAQPMESPTSQATPAQTAPKRSAGRLPGVAIGLLALAALGALAIISNTRSDPAAAPALTPTSVLPTAVVATLQPAVARTDCPSLAAWNELLAGYERRGQWRLAASSTETALRTPGLCAADRQTLANKLVAVTSETLFLDPAPPEDAPGQRRAAEAYTSLKLLALRQSTPAPPPLPIARTAYAQRLYVLASVAFSDAFVNGDASTADRDVVQTDSAARRAVGLAWAQRPEAALRTEGLAWLATACRIDEQLRIGTTDACMDLTRLVGPRQAWPPPLPDPLLASPADSVSNDRIDRGGLP
jgi:hypothetical protein